SVGWWGSGLGWCFWQSVGRGCATGDASASVRRVVRVERVAVSLAIESLWRRQVVVSALVTGPDVAMDVDTGPASGFSPFPLPDSIAPGPGHVRLGPVRGPRGPPAP